MLSLSYWSGLSIGNFDDLISLTEQNHNFDDLISLTKQNLPNKLSVKELSSSTLTYSLLIVVCNKIVP